MPSYSRVLLSGSTNGRPIPVVAIASPGTLIHTAVGGSAVDEISIWVSNVSAAAAKLSLQWGGTTDPGDMAVKAYSIPANSTMLLIADRQPLNNGLVLRAFSDIASVLNIMGKVTRIV